MHQAKLTIREVEVDEVALARFAGKLGPGPAGADRETPTGLDAGPNKPKAALRICGDPYFFLV